MSLKNVCFFSMICFLGSLAWAQEAGSDQQEHQIVHDVTFQIGSLDIEERDEHFFAIMKKMDGSIPPSRFTGFTYDWSGEVLRVAETMHIGRYFALDGALAYYGESEMATTISIEEEDGKVVDTTHSIVARYTSFELSAMGKYPLFDNRLVAYARLGGNYSRGEYTMDSRTVDPGSDATSSSDDVISTAHFNQDEDDFALEWGAGVYTTLNNKFVLRLDYTSGKLDQVETSSLFLGLGFRYK